MFDGILSWVIVWLMVLLVFDSEWLVGRLKEIVDVVDSFWWFIDSGVLVGCYLVKQVSGIGLLLLLMMNILFRVLMFWVQVGFIFIIILYWLSGWQMVEICCWLKVLFSRLLVFWMLMLRCDMVFWLQIRFILVLLFC